MIPRPEKRFNGESYENLAAAEGARRGSHRAMLIEGHAEGDIPVIKDV